MRLSIWWIPLFVGLVACHRGNRTGPIRLGFFPNFTQGQALVGNAEGTFHQALQGRPLEMKQFMAGPSAMEALLGGSLDLCYVGSGPAITAFSRAPGMLHIIAGAASGGAVFVVRGIRNARELIGKRVASPQMGNSQDVALRFWLKGQGLPFSETAGRRDAVTVTPLSNADIFGLFKRGDLGGAWVPEPWGARLRHDAGGRIFLDERTLWPDGKFPTTVLVVSHDALIHRREDIKAILRAHLALTARAQQQPEPFAKALNEAYGTLTSHPLGETVLKDALSRIEFTSELLPTQLQLAADHSRALGFIPSSDINGLVDDSLLREVQEPAGR